MKKKYEEILKKFAETVVAIANEHYPNREGFKEAITTLGRSRSMRGNVLAEFISWALTQYDSQVQEYMNAQPRVEPGSEREKAILADMGKTVGELYVDHKYDRAGYEKAVIALGESKSFPPEAMAHFVNMCMTVYDEMVQERNSRN